MSVIEISAQDAFAALKNDPNSVLVDVRTFEEFNFVGFVNPTDFSNRMALLPWQLYPEMNENAEFAINLEASLEKLFGDKSRKVQIFFLCRTGGRSAAAANYALNLGYQNCYNITHGFEGDLNQNNHRAQINGWKADRLPWRQK